MGKAAKHHGNLMACLQSVVVLLLWRVPVPDGEHTVEERVVPLEVGCVVSRSGLEGV